MMGSWMGTRTTQRSGIAGTVTQNVDGFQQSTKSKDPRLETFYNNWPSMTTDLEELYSNIQREADEITVREHFGLVQSFGPLSFSGEPSRGCRAMER